MSSQDVVSFFARLVEWALDLVQSLVTFVSTKLLGHSSSFLSVSWKGLLVILILGGTALNVVIYMQRWKPHWWWFAKKRMVVDDALVEKKQKRAADSAPPRKPSTYIPKRIDTNPSHKAPARGSLTDDGDLMATDSDDLMSTHKNKKRQ